MHFDDLNLIPPLLSAVRDMGYDQPTPIQRETIPPVLAGRDVLGCAQTGTGKTAAFGLPLLQRIDVVVNSPQALIIAPTRELCLQIAGDLADFSKYIDGLKILPVYGGSSIESQIRSLRNGVQVIVATPGRLIDLIKRGVVKLQNVHTVVLDELSKYADPQPGQEVVTTGFSQYFPADVLIGWVESALLNETRTAYRVHVRLAAEMTRLTDVILVENRDLTEVRELQNSEKVEQHTRQNR